MSLAPVSKIINKIACKNLIPIGVKQQGRSRTWLDDNGWWCTVIEFQPSSGRQGSYLNVGVNFQWYPKDYFSFDIGHRVSDFVEYETDEQFELAVLEYAEFAKDRVLENRKVLSTPKAAQKYVKSSFQDSRLNVWAEFHQGMVCAIAKDNDEAIYYFRQVLDSPYDSEWAIELKEFTNKLVVLFEAEEDFFPHFDRIVSSSRHLKKLIPTDIKLRRQLS